MLTFEVVGFWGAYHAILGCPCYAKFMAISNYTYLKLKMPGPKGVITIGSSFEHAYECDVECIEHTEAQNGMVCSLEPHHLEGEYLLAEVGCCAEAHGQIDLAEGLDPLPRRDAVEWRLAGRSLSNPIPMSSKVGAYMMLRLLPPSMSTLEKRVLPMMGSTTSG